MVEYVYEAWAGGSSLDELRQYYDIAEEDAVLDIGCGALPFPPATLLADIKEPAFFKSPQGRTLQAERPFQLCSIYDLPFKDQAFDFVYCAHVLEHLEYPEKACREMERVGGRGYIECPRSWMEIVFPADDHHWLVENDFGQLIFRACVPEDKRDVLQLKSSIFDIISDFEYQKYWNSRSVRQVRNVEFYWEKSIAIDVVEAEQRRNAGRHPWFYQQRGKTVSQESEIPYSSMIRRLVNRIRDAGIFLGGAK